MEELENDLECLYDINLELVHDMNKLSEDKVIYREESLYSDEQRASNYSSYYEYKYCRINEFYIKQNLKIAGRKSFSMVDYTGNESKKTPKYKENSISVRTIFFIELIYFLYITGVKFDKFKGVKEAYMQVEQFQPSKAVIKIIKKFYALVGIVAHKSGEIAIPSNLESYMWMKYVIFSNDFTNWILKPKSLCNITNRLEEAFYAEAEENYYTTQYKGSKHEKYDTYLKESATLMLEKSDKLKAEADLLMIKTLQDNNLPVDSTIEIVQLQWDVWDITTKKPIYINEIVLNIGSYSSFVEIITTDYFRFFVNNQAIYGTKLRIKKSYNLAETNNIYIKDSERIVMQETIKECLEIISSKEDIVSNEIDKKVLLFDLVQDFNSCRDAHIHSQIEEYFWENGLEHFFLKKYDAPEITADEHYDSIANCELDMRVGV